MAGWNTSFSLWDGLQAVYDVILSVFLTRSKPMPSFFQVCLTPPARERKWHNLDVPHPGWRDALLVMVEDAAGGGNGVCNPSNLR